LSRYRASLPRKIHGKCVKAPLSYRAAFAEIAEDRNHHRTRYLLERAFQIAKPYDLITTAQADQFRKLRFAPTIRRTRSKSSVAPSI